MEIFKQFTSDRNSQYRSRGGRCGTQVGDEIADRDVRFMPDRADDRNAAAMDGSRHRLLVESPQILKRSAAATDDDDVDSQSIVTCVQAVQRRDDLTGGLVALDRDWVNAHCDTRKPSADRLKYVPDSRPRGAGDHRDVRRAGGNLPLASRLEKTFGLEFLMKLAKGQLQHAHAPGFEFAGVELIPARPRIHVDFAGGDHFQAVLRIELQPLCRRTPHHTGQLAGLIFEREIDVPALVPREVAHFADNVNGRRHAVTDHALDERRHLRNRHRRGSNPVRRRWK